MINVIDGLGIWWLAIQQIIFSLPLIAVYIAGIIISYTKAEKYPQVSLLARIGFGINLVMVFVSAFLTTLTFRLQVSGYRVTEIGLIVGIIGFVIMLINVGAIAMIIRSIWKDRP